VGEGVAIRVGDVAGVSVSVGREVGSIVGIIDSEAGVVGMNSTRVSAGKRRTRIPSAAMTTTAIAVSQKVTGDKRSLMTDSIDGGRVASMEVDLDSPESSAWGVAAGIRCA
jgi:hypothetical protein